MRFAVITSFLFSLRLGHAWTTTISFQVYVECLEQNPVGLLASNIVSQFDPSIPLFFSEYSNGRQRGYTWQVYPSEILAPVRPARPPDYLPQFNPRYVAVGHCTNVAPGTCCRPLTPLVTNGQFSNLPSGAISAFWGPEVHTTAVVNGCNEYTLKSHYGSPQWAWQDPVFPPRISGASYISCPSGQIDRGWGAVLAGFCSKLKRRGAASVVAPPTTADSAWVWPDIIMVNGVNYTDDRKGDLMYHDKKDTLLNLTRLVEKKS